MPLPIIADTYRVALNWTGPGSLIASNVMHFRNPAGTAAGLYSALDANVAASMWGLAPTTTACSLVEISKLDGSSATYNAFPAGAKWAGPATAGDVIPAGAVVVSFRTALRGRRNRGRIYLPFVTEINIQNGVAAAGSLTACSVAWASFLSAMNTAGYALVIASYVGGSAQAVTTATVKTTLATQRRRQSRLW